MKPFLLSLILAFWSCQAFALNAKIDCGGTTLGTTYATSSPSLQSVFTNVPVRQTPRLAVWNATAGRICVNTVTYSSTAAPTAGNGNEHCLPPQAFGFYDGINTAIGVVNGKPQYTTNIYARADGSSCTSGIVDIDLW